MLQYGMHFVEESPIKMHEIYGRLLGKIFAKLAAAGLFLRWFVCLALIPLSLDAVPVLSLEQAINKKRFLM